MEQQGIMSNRFAAAVYIDSNSADHGEKLLGMIGNSSQVVLGLAKSLIKDIFTPEYINRHQIDIHLYDPNTRRLNCINYSNP